MEQSENEIKNEIKRLVHSIKHYNESYFQKGITETSDYAYDQLLEQLIQLEEAYPHLKPKDSPTQTLGERTISTAVAYHQIPMLSLAKTYSEEEIAQFAKRTKKILANEAINFVCEPKIDGIALSIVYEQGHLARIVTRGDGEKGDNITHNALKFLAIPRKIENISCSLLEIRGEACMQKSVFEACNKERKIQGLPLWANPRNITTGTLKALDLGLMEGRQLSFYAYSFYAPAYQCITQQEVLELLMNLGFPVMPIYKVCYAVKEIMAYIHYWQQHKDDLPVGIDGIVIKVNGLSQQQLLGNTSKSPRWAIAYKYQPEVAHSTLEKVSFQIGRTGAVTPVAHFKPIVLAGTMVQRASLYNAAILASKNLYLGDTIFIEKGGEIIPKIVGVDPTKRPKNGTPIVFTTVCPACGTTLHRAMEAIAYYCPNKRCCLPQLKGALLHFSHRKAMDINTLGPKTIDALLDAQLVKTTADLYTLRYEDLHTLPGFQTLSIQKLLSNIQASKRKPFEKVLFALGIQHIGETVAKKLALYFGSITQLQHATLTDLLHIPDVGATIARSILHYFQDPYQQAILKGLQAAGLRFALPITNNPSGALPLSGKCIVISGTFQHFTRTELFKLIEQADGTVVTAISSKVDYLIAGEKAGPSKLAKAKTLAIPILGEKELMRIIQHGEPILEN